MTGLETVTLGANAVASGEVTADAVLVTAVRNEAPFLLEWIAYHKLIGFAQIVALSNSSEDGTEEILAALAAAGEIVHHHVDTPDGQSPQYAARVRFEAEEGYRQGAWYLWLDADEFLNVHVGARRLPDLLAALKDAQGILLNWRMFGSSGHAQHPGRYVSRDFPGASRRLYAPNRETKSLFRKTPAILGFAPKPSRRPRLAADHGLTAADFLGGNGRALSADGTSTRHWLAGNEGLRNNLLQPAETGWALAQINHYSVRTPDFYALKALRGRGAGRVGGKYPVRHTEDYFLRHDQNVQNDLSIAVWEAPVTAEMARLAALPGVAGALDRSARLVRAMLKAAPVAAAQTPAEPVPAVVTADAATRTGSMGKTDFPAEVQALVEARYRAAETILEYGGGPSTLFAAGLGLRVTCVEADPTRAQGLIGRLALHSGQAAVHLVGIGPTDAEGMPTRPRFFRQFPQYALSVWDRPDLGVPDLVLIDGRFRAACLAAVMLRATRPTTVLFDDYVDRKYYHGVEKLARKDEVVGRMARFTVTPGPIPPEMLTQVISWFSDPR